MTKFCITLRRRDHANPPGQRNVEDYIQREHVTADDIVKAAEMAFRLPAEREGDWIVDGVERIW